MTEKLNCVCECADVVAQVVSSPEVDTVDSVWNGINVGLIILVILLILLALIIGFNKLKNNKDDEDGATYY